MMPLEDILLKQRYQLQRQLGKNANRQTWLAQDLAQTPSVPVVVKLLALSPQMQWSEFKLFEREAAVLQVLNHSQIPQYRDYFLVDSLLSSRFSWFCLIQEYIAGTSLQDLLNQGRNFALEEVKKIAIEVLNILGYLHNHEPPILHRDIKPSNLLWGKDGQIYLVDFGAVQDQAAAAGATFTVVGTYGYVPMEQFAGQAVPASDLYALGMTLIHLLTGVAPADLPHENGRIKFADQTSIDHSIIYWLDQLTEPNLSVRFSSAEKTLQAWQNRQTLSASTTYPKPPGSLIQLHKSAADLEVHLPARAQYVDSDFYLEVFAAKIQVTIGCTGCVLGFLGPLLYPVLLVYLLVSSLSMTFSQTELQGNRRYIRILRKLCGFPCWLPQRINLTSLRSVDEVVLVKNSNIMGIRFESSDGREVCTNPLSKVEREWLIREI